MKICYIGNTGSGKTLAGLQQALTYYFQRLDNGQDITLYSNIELFLQDEPEVKWEYFNKPHHVDKFKNGIVLFDEMWKWVDSRLSSSKKNRFLSSWSIITRKRKLDLLITEQYEKMIDVRIRAILNYIVYPYQKDYNQELSNKRGEPTFNITVCRAIPVNETVIDMKYEEYEFRNSDWFNYYNTYEEPREFGYTFMEWLDRTQQEILSCKDLQFFKNKKDKIDFIAENWNMSQRRARIAYNTLFGVET